MGIFKPAQVINAVKILVLPVSETVSGCPLPGVTFIDPAFMISPRIVIN